MNKKTKKDIRLLDKSIEHWFENITMLQLNYYMDCDNLDQDVFVFNHYTDVYTLGDHCPLCKEYGGKNSCVECPIKQKSGTGGCDNTPWVATYNNSFSSFNFTKIFKAFSDELNFLIELREELANES